MKQGLIISRAHYQEMQNYAEQHTPLESCGLLAGKNQRVEKVIFVANQAASPTRFIMDPYEQLRAFDWIEANHLELLAIFHSHPAGPETVSATDIAEAAYEVVHLIWSRNQARWKLRGFWIEHGRSTEIPVNIEE